MLELRVEGKTYVKGKQVALDNYFRGYFNYVFEESTKANYAKIRPVSKLLTRHIKDNLKNGNSKYIASGRIAASDRLMDLDKSLTEIYKTDDSIASSVAFVYKFPKNDGTEYGYPLGSKYSKIGRTKDAILRLAEWVELKSKFYPSIFKYWSYKSSKASGKIKKFVVPTKKYQFRSIAYAIAKNQGKIRKYNVHQWYKINIDKNDVKSYLERYKNLTIKSLKETFNNGK